MSEQHTLSEGQTMVLQARIGSVCASERFWFCTIGHQATALVLPPSMINRRFEWHNIGRIAQCPDRWGRDLG